MIIFDYFLSENKEHWLSEISKGDWGAADYLHYLLKEDKLSELVGEARVLLLTEDKELLGFCTLAQKDDIQPTDLTPWIGFLYTFPSHRGKRLAGKLLSHAEALAKQDGAEAVHISTNHIGLYEKYGYSFLCEMNDIEGEPSRVYIKRL